jgi:4-amino-4-deoxychorismate lyase
MISEDSELEMESTETAPRSFHALYPDSFIAEPPKGSNEWKIQLSSTLITASPYTQHKTTKREVYDTARAHLPTGDIFTEILLQNTHGEVMEGTLSTPYFLRRGKWITPAQKCGGNRGTTRRWALEKGYCVEGVIRAEDLQDGEVIWLSTGNRGFGWGYLSLRKGNRKLEPQAEVFELA